MNFELTATGKIPYGRHLEQETKEEAVERVYNLIVSNNQGYRVKDGYDTCRLYEKDGKLLFDRNNYDKERHLKSARGLEDEVFEVLEIVEQRILKEIYTERAAEEARRKAEAEAARARKDAETKAQYASWKAESERLGIPFRDLCDMKRAKMEEAMFDDWDD